MSAVSRNLVRVDAAETARNDDDDGGDCDSGRYASASAATVNASSVSVEPSRFQV
jgi:hypothetical protein